MFGASIAARLPELRALAESVMVDSCVITGTTPGAWDDETGTTGDPVTVTFYSGRCRLRMPATNGARVQSGDASWAVDDGVLSLPVDGSEAVASGHVAVVTLANDPASPVSVTVQAGHVQTFSTARRLPVKLVSRDA